MFFLVQLIHTGVVCTSFTFVIYNSFTLVLAIHPHWYYYWYFIRQFIHTDFVCNSSTLVFVYLCNSLLIHVVLQFTQYWIDKQIDQQPLSAMTIILNILASFTFMHWCSFFGNPFSSVFFCASSPLWCCFSFIHTGAVGNGIHIGVSHSSTLVPLAMVLAVHSHLCLTTHPHLHWRLFAIHPL